MRASNPRAITAQIAALTRWSQSDGVAGTAPARRAGPGSDDYWLAEVDPNHELTERERSRRARAAKKAFYLRLAKRSADVRRRRNRGR